MANTYQAVVVGLGRIGSSYPSSEVPRSHVEAYTKNQRIAVVSGVDSDRKARYDFSQKWGNNFPVFSTVKEMLSEIHPDIVSICLPPAVLSSVVAEFANIPPKLFFLEKPVATNPDDLQTLFQGINNVPTAVNYHRCWDPSHIRFFEHVLDSDRVISTRVIYANGMFNYASHMVALLIRYYGAVTSVINMPAQMHNKQNFDPSLSFILEFKAGMHAVFQGFDDIPYDLLEMEIMTTSGLFSLKSAGCRKRQELPICDIFYPNYSQLNDVPYTEQDGQVQGLAQAVENIVNYLDGTEDGLSCDLSLASDVFEVMWGAKECTSFEKR